MSVLNSAIIVKYATPKQPVTFLKEYKMVKITGGPTRRQLKQSNQLSLPRQDNCKTRKDTKYCITEQTTQNPYKQCEAKTAINPKQRNHAIDRTAA